MDPLRGTDGALVGPAKPDPVEIFLRPQATQRDLGIDPGACIDSPTIDSQPLRLHIPPSVERRIQRMADSSVSAHPSGPYDRAISLLLAPHSRR